jgi:hypothetical protein
MQLCSYCCTCTHALINPSALYFAPAGIISCLCGSTLRILLEFLLPKDGSLVAFGQYALQYGTAVPGLPTFMEVTPAANSSSLVWNPEQDTCDQSECACANGKMCACICAFTLLTPKGYVPPTHTCCVCITCI